MATQQQVQNTLLAATLKVANLVNNNLVVLTGGGLTVDWRYINLFQRCINCVQRQYDLGDYVSAPFILAYDRLLLFVGTYGTGTININAQNPNTIINPISGFEPITLYFTQAQLVDADPPNGNWYLPVMLTNTQRVASVTVNGVGFTVTPDYTVSPIRLYGFSNNDPQIISVTII